MDLMLFVGLWVVCGIASAVIASSKGRDLGVWAIAGFVLGPIGVLMAIGVAGVRPGEVPLSSGEVRKCPACAELVRREAIKCRFCGTELTPMPLEASVVHPRGDDYHLRMINCGGCHRGRPREGSVLDAGKHYCAECAAARGLVA